MRNSRQKRESHMLVFDASLSARSVDENGYMHVKSSHITKATVNPYYGAEIPGWKEQGLDPDEIYYGYRDPDELQKSLTTWEGLPLHLEHHVDSAEDPQKETRVGSIGTGVRWNAPYVDAPLTIWDKDAIDAIESGDFKALSCGYRYEPDWTSGEVDGIPYDFVMRNISGNHVALVADGRAGPEVVVADQNIRLPKGGNNMKRNRKTTLAKDSDPAVEKKEVDLAQAIIDLHKIDPETGEVTDVTEDDDKAEALRQAIGDIADKLSPEELAKLCAAVEGLAFAQDCDGKDEDPDAADEDEGEAAPADEDATEDDDEPAADDDDTSADEDATEDEDEPAADEDATEDEDDEPQAQDHKPRKRARRMALDAKAVRAQAVADTKKHMRALFAACDFVAPLVGKVRAMSFDSASAVYEHALRRCGYNPDKFPRAAWQGMVYVLRTTKANGGDVKAMAKDSKTVELGGPFKNLKNIII